MTLWLAWAGLLSLVSSTLHAQYQQIKMTRIGPTVEVTDLSGQEPTFTGKDGDLVDEQDLVVTIGDGSRVILVFSNGATINISQNSEVRVEQFTQDPFAGNYSFANATAEPPSRSQTKLHLTRGELIGNVKSLNAGSSFEVTTPAGAAGIRGTTFRVVFRPNGDGSAFFTVTTIEGDVGVTTYSGTTDGVPISVKDQEEIEILVEVNDETGEVTVLTPTSEIVVEAASPEVIAQVTAEVQEAVAAVVEIVLTDASTGGQGENNEQGEGEGEGDASGDGEDAEANKPQSNTPTPQTQNDSESPLAGG